MESSHIGGGGRGCNMRILAQAARAPLPPCLRTGYILLHVALERPSHAQQRKRHRRLPGASRLTTHLVTTDLLAPLLSVARVILSVARVCSIDSMMLQMLMLKMRLLPVALVRLLPTASKHELMHARRTERTCDSTWHVAHSMCGEGAQSSRDAREAREAR